MDHKSRGNIEVTTDVPMRTPNKLHCNSWRRLILSAQSPVSIYRSVLKKIKRNRDTIFQNCYLAIKDPSIMLKTHQCLGPYSRNQ